jgi:hypothetical protein
MNRENRIDYGATSATFPAGKANSRLDARSNYLRPSAFNDCMRQKPVFGICLLAAGIAGMAFAQTPTLPQSQDAAPSTAAPLPNSTAGPVVLEWTPPAWAALTAKATTKSSFTLDRTMLLAASNLLSDTDNETRQAIGKIDGVSVHLLRFGGVGIPDEASVTQIREAYHLRGWKHVVSTNTATENPKHSGNTDVWLVLDGVNIRGAVVLAETPQSLTLATLTGNLSPVDLLHLRGHFGIPRFDAGGFKDAEDK